MDGAPTEDKLVTIDLELDSKDHLDTASGAKMRLHSANDTYVDLHLRPIDGEGKQAASSSRVRGRFELSKHSDSGYWWARQIVLFDAGGNQRFQGPADYGWKMYVDNPSKDSVGPRYVPGSLRMRVVDETNRFEVAR